MERATNKDQVYPQGKLHGLLVDENGTKNLFLAGPSE